MDLYVVFFSCLSETQESIKVNVLQFLDNGYVYTKENGCNLCKMPGRNNTFWTQPYEPAIQMQCNDPDNPCDMCTCVAGNPPKMLIEKDGCKKPQKCPKPCKSSTEEHHAGDTWQCWIDDYK